MPAVRRMLSGVALAAVLVACTGPVAGRPVTEKTPAPVATATTAATPSAPTSAEADADPAAGRDTELGRQVEGLIAASISSRRPLEQRFLAVIRQARFDPDARWDRALTLTIDKVTWNEDFTDGGDEAPFLNPTVRWEKIRIPQVVVTIVPHAEPQVLTTAEFVSYINHYGEGMNSEDVFRLPFVFSYVGSAAVALQEHYIP